MPATRMTHDEAQPEAVALFVSDVHLQPGLPKTTAAFLDWLQRHARSARQLYLLGDMFEYWAGDDDLFDPYHQRIIGALKEVSVAGTEVFWIAGNRDFLVGPEFAKTAGLSVLPEPHLLTIAGKRIALLHGDAQCTDDTAYMAFREQVRNPAWQQEFLAMPLQKRKAIINGMRSGSKEAARMKPAQIMDVNPQAVRSVFDATGADYLIHGHTHRPARHEAKATGEVRYVLPDWDCDASPPRGGWIAVDGAGTVSRHDLDGKRL
ncbi:UDP-2,3-diacylglucosamine hydrolase [Noviherbaspirillum humi]|uniref:UDP-2,3-diacylglucosamine hydrolase n=1 Tax=Noviherbaspirillum humi TaxID=1688639 RepID=A0A239FRK7_9BURK|nr:UDP-2,3-diacylglucosamine diphosphatase [Noviherbaspirillum humi]SNS59686.1 UDP-2,3-diacylglucosamine hydrolase [Noviherbaspirillum humi]